jgi:hypothetical protein
LDFQAIVILSSITDMHVGLGLRTASGIVEKPDEIKEWLQGRCRNGYKYGRGFAGSLLHPGNIKCMAMANKLI